MKLAEHNPQPEASTSAATEIPAQIAAARPQRLSLRASLHSHWPEYLMEAGLLGSFMISACTVALLLHSTQSPLSQAIRHDFLRRLLGGVAMGITALALIYSPWGRQSGAHMNPAVTLTFLRLGKIQIWDTVLYVAAQFTGALLGVFLMARFFKTAISHPSVRYIVTTPGPLGPWPAFIAELLIAAALMLAVLHFSNSPRLSKFTGLFASILVAAYITIEAPLSGMSMNPARSFGSALNAGVWDSFWIYVTAPLAGMITASEIYLKWKGLHAVKCCKLHHENLKRCIFCGANGGFNS
jgi:aquaporin Z